MTARVYLRFLEQYDMLQNAIVLKYFKVLKNKESKKDFFVPIDEEVIKTFNKIKSHSALRLIYLILATSGVRYVECLSFLKDYDKDKFTVHSNYVSYNVSELRHTKNINNIYLPLFVYNQLKPVTNSYHCLRQKYHLRKCSFSLKYLRKWQYNFLIYNSVPESVADFIQGRANRSISANHYLARSQQADFWYAKVCDKLEYLFSVMQPQKTSTSSQAYLGELNSVNSVTIRGETNESRNIRKSKH
ncbi:MAG: hypothetical protein QS98_C0005G0029 [archaeon GW2011_AR3]|nr:MAG: hypothetical protein QS98_C0005G0029 [archaeon GW2011_AR3]